MVPAGECVIELECAECLPEKMPAVTSHAARAGAVRVPHGEEAALSCGAGHFLLYARPVLAVRCDGGRWRVGADGALRSLFDLGCQEDVLEDVEHAVQQCAPPLQGRAYETRAARVTAHLATLCFDADRALTVSARVSASPRGVPLPAHSDARAPLSILGNFNHMFDSSTRHQAERLFSNDARLDRRLRELFKHDRYTFAGQTLTAGKLLAPGYFDSQYARVTEFASNKVLSWKSVVEGNLQHLHADVGGFMARSRATDAVDVYAGTHGVLTLNTGGDTRPEVYLSAGRRFPVPRYIWTVVHSPRRNEGIALVLLNDPYVTVSEIRDAVFCTSKCGQVSWLEHLTRQRNYERPLLGLVFCCDLPAFASHVPEAPRIYNDTVQLLHLK